MRSIITFSLDACLQIRVLDAKIGKLELQLNSEQEKISSCAGLLEEIISKPQGSLCSSVQAERDRARAKRDRAYQNLQRQQLEMEIHDHNGLDGAPNPPAGAIGAGASNYRISKELGAAS